MRRSYDLLKFGLMWGNVGMQELGWEFEFFSNIAFGVVDMHKSTCHKSVCCVAGHNFIIYDSNSQTQVLFNSCSSILQVTKQDQEVLCANTIQS
jgi:hypothetical protein